MRALRQFLALALVALAMAAAPPAHAGTTGRVAVMWHNFNDDPSSGFNRLRDRAIHVMQELRDCVIPATLIAAQDTTQTGHIGVDDSTYMRQNYDALIVPEMGALSNTATNASNDVHLGWRPNTARATFNDVAINGPSSPFSGKWGIPVFVMVFDCPNNATVGYTNGITTFSGNATVSAKMQRTSALCPTFDGTTGDTVFVNSRNAIRDLTNTDVYVLMGGVNGKTFTPGAAADSITYWHYQPDLTKPGVYYFNIRENDPVGDTNGIVSSYGDAIMLGQMCQVTGIKPASPFVAWYDMDHVEPAKGTVTDAGRAASFNVADFTAFSDSLRSWGWVMSGPLFCGASLGNATLSSDNGGNGFVQPEVKQIVKDYEKQYSFHVHDHFDVNTQTWRASAQDTASICRPAYNTAIANARSSMWDNLTRIQSGGSFNFHVTLPQDDCDWRAAKVFADAGVQEIRVPGGYYLYQQPSYVRQGSLWVAPFTFPTRYRAPGGASIWLSGALATVTSTVRTMTNFAAPDYQQSNVNWNDNAYSMWLKRGATYFHGNENFQGAAANPSAVCPVITYLKHQKNLLKLTRPFVVPLNDGTAQYKMGSEIAGQ